VTGTVAGEIALADEAATLRAGSRAARALRAEPGPVVVTLAGALGSGKTTFVRGLLRTLGVAGAIRSPSYTLVEEHAAGGWEVLHLDLYRLAEGDSLQEFGLRDRQVAGVLLLVEWPERAAARALPPVDLALTLRIRPQDHRLAVSAHSPAGGNLARAVLRDQPDDSPLSP
jgi:tRNA threonylcarbamoyladenosine biosynthesis protein TsaE